MVRGAGKQDMKNFEKEIDRIFPVIGDCAIYKLRSGMASFSDGCSHKCKECQDESKKWLLEEAEE